jgi:hypothetical protein
LRELDDAIATANDAPKVLEVIAALRGMAIGGDVSAARLYLDRTMGPVHEPVEDDLSEVPTEELVAKLVELPETRATLADAIMQNPDARAELKRRLTEMG